MATIIKRDKIAAEAIDIYKSIDPAVGFLLMEFSGRNYTYTDQALQNTIKLWEKKKTKMFHPVSLTSVASTLPCYASSIRLGTKNRTSKSRVLFGDRTGVFKLEFSDGTFLILAKWIDGVSRHQLIASIMVGEESTFHKYLTFQECYNKSACKPKNGIYTVKTDGQGQTFYEKLKKIQHTPVIHPSVEDVTFDLDNYFNNVDAFTQFGMSGTRKVLLVGPPGTGKSSYAYMIAARHKGCKSIVFANCVQSVATHLVRCAKSNVPTIIIWEDAETSGLSYAGADTLNFLDGIDQPQTKQGAYIIMTTNDPEKIDPRIKKRPGRIDRIFEFGPLHGEYALMCAHLYFSTLFPYILGNKSAETKLHFTRLANIVTGMTGAAIKGLSYSSRLYAAGQRLPMTLDLVIKVKAELDEDYKKVDKYAESTESISRSGFQVDNTKKPIELDWSKISV
jgi:SpoVK/Ycf46/Vps4 family AAA+-type ATPase